MPSQAMYAFLFQMCTSKVQGTHVPSVQNLSTELKPVRTKWFLLGINLGLKKDELDRIKIDFACEGCDRQLLEMSDKWLQCTPNAIWGDVVSALQQIEENRVAEDISRKYICGGSKL